MVIYFATHSFLGMPIHLEHVFIGIGIAVVVMVPAVIFYIKKSRKKLANTSSVLKSTKHEAQTEKVKADIVLSAIDDGVIMIGADKLIQVFNRGASKITGWAQEEANGLEYHSVLQLIDSKGVSYTDDQDAFSIVFRDKQPYRDNQAVLHTKSDRKIPVVLSVSPLLDGDQNVIAVVGIFRDVTQERAEEQQRAEFISTASHEMRTPVAAIEGYLALALNEKVANVDSKARGYLEKAHSSTQHLGKLFQDLLTSAKAEDGRLVSHPQVVDVGALLEQITDSLRFSAEKKGLLLEFLIGSNNPENVSTGGERTIRPLYYANVDPDRLREVLTNLFDNAIKYTETGKISIGLTGNDEVVQFFIKDTGAGIPPEDVSHLFQKFYRVDSTATRTIGGTGLGLFISRKIIELYEGRIWVESELDHGSTFYINLPRLSSAKATQMLEQQNQAASPLSP